jgi:tetratricopeptide (TPR) repeat protein
MKKYIGALICIVVLASCSDTKESNGSYLDENFDKIKAAKQIEELEAVLISAENKSLNLGTAQEVIVAYKEYAKQLPLDVVSAEYLFKAADVEMGLQQYRKAEVIYNRVYDNYHSYKNRVMCMYLTAFINDNHLNQKGRAKEIYQRLIARHPEDKLAQDAIASLDLLTLSDDELIQFLKEKNAIIEDTVK